MMSRATWPHGIVLQIVLVLGALALSVIQTPPAARAQSCSNCVVVAGVDLDLLAEPRLEAVVLRVIPRESLLRRDAGSEINRLVPVTYGGVSGWVIADGIFPAPKRIAGYATTASTAPPAPSTTTSSNARVTLAPLMLRSAPTMEAEPILVMPLGEVVTLTWEGTENGYVTVDYGGVRGWAYADLLAEPGGSV
jgi:Bacterial SH3 domain